MFILFLNVYVLVNVENTVHAQQYYGTIEYYNYVNGMNLTTSIIYMNITVYKNAPRSLWLIVPKDWNGDIITSDNLSLNVRKYPLYSNNKENPFYANLTINYNYYDTFSFIIEYKHPYSLLIVEPNAVYYSPLLGHSLWLRRIYVLDIENVSFKEVKSSSPVSAKIVIGKNNLKAVFEGNTFNRVSLFLITNSYDSFINVSKGDISIKTPARYYNIAHDLLNQVSEIYYNNMTKLFNMYLGNVTITFYVPESQSDFSVGGYVPYSGGNVGDIHVNLIYYRGISGELLLIILHEMVHRFLFKLNIDPNKLLWVHEGLAEYISTTLTKNLPASIDRIETLKNLAKNLNTYGFIENWKPSDQINNILVYYAASYTVFDKLGEKYGGLNSYAKFFRLLSKKNISSTQDVVEVLNSAWNTDVTPLFIEWGFTSLQYDGKSSLKSYIENIADNATSLPWWMQPAKWIIEAFINIARNSLEKNQLSLAKFYANVALIIYTYAKIASYIVLASIIILIVLLLKERELASK